MSRRALLGYSSSAAAGAVLASAGPAQAEAEEGAVAEQAAGSTTEWPWGAGIEFSGVTPPGPEEGSLRVTFSLTAFSSPTAQAVNERDIADAINELLISRGWPSIPFYGALTTPLN
ncbi:hypothetical protein [Streptomyces sp. Root1310]|uniref:hypothetical protein n=1 Tax=Streptomyces sp. Root1310 TaxID=1736452 RepID=UPI00070A8EAD|nr:hypothetical protein [Streptomyces sp. Root1310]KQX73637.1 hypothetical protein ASD48_38790 [Streptomyces sp. Root1310]